MDIIKRITEENEKSRSVEIQNINPTNVSTGRTKSEEEKKNAFSFVKFPGTKSGISNDSNRPRGLYYRKTKDILNPEASKTERNFKNEALEAVIEECDQNFKTDRGPVNLGEKSENFTAYEKERFPGFVRDSSTTVKNKFTKIKKKSGGQTQKTSDCPFKPWTPEVSESSILE